MSSSNRRPRSSRPALHERGDVADAPHGQRIVVGDEADRRGALAMQPARQQHAERLVREPALEGIDDQEMPVAAREGLDQHLAGIGDHGALGLQAQPLADRRRAAPSTAARRPACGARARPDAWTAGTCRPRRRGSSARDRCVRETSASVSCRPSKRTTSPAKAKVSPTRQLLDEGFLQLAQHAAAEQRARRARLAPRAPADQADLDHRRLDDGADVEAVLLGEARMREAQARRPASA